MHNQSDNGVDYTLSVVEIYVASAIVTVFIFRSGSLQMCVRYDDISGGNDSLMLVHCNNREGE